MSYPVPSDLARSDPRPAPGSEDKLDRLRTLLREMFQLDRGDLDFGLYRIMNLKADEITAFLDNDLLPQVQGYAAGDLRRGSGEAGQGTGDHPLDGEEARGP